MDKNISSKRKSSKPKRTKIYTATTTTSTATTKKEQKKNFLIFYVIIEMVKKKAYHKSLTGSERKYNIKYARVLIFMGVVRQICDSLLSRGL